MAGQRRGFSSERHGRLKLVLSGVALAGFAGGWLGFASSHPPLEEPATPTHAETVLSTSAVPPSRTPAPAGAATATATVAGEPPEPLPTFARPKRSRGS